MKYIRLICLFLIAGSLGCASVQTSKKNDNFLDRYHVLGDELTSKRAELNQLMNEESRLMDTLDGQRISVVQLEQQLQQLRLKEQELNQALNSYTKNMTAIQPVLNSLDVECRKKIENNNDKILSSLGNLILDLAIPSPVQVLKIFFKIPALIENIGNIISFIETANDTLAVIRNMSDTQPC